MNISRSNIEDSLIIFLLLFSPFAFASVHTWAYSIIALVSVVLFNIHFVLELHGSVKESKSQRVKAGRHCEEDHRSDAAISSSNTLTQARKASNDTLTQASNASDDTLSQQRHPERSEGSNSDTLTQASNASDDTLTLLKVLRQPTSIVILIFLVINILYIVPLPRSVIKVLSPKVFEMRETYMFEAPYFQTLSVYPRATISYLIKLISFILIYLVIFSKILYMPGAQRPAPRPRSIRPAFIMFGAIMGVLSILFHSFVDFNLHMPSNALYFTVLLTIIAALSTSGKPENRGQRQKAKGQGLENSQLTTYDLQEQHAPGPQHQANESSSLEMSGTRYPDNESPAPCSQRHAINYVFLNKLVNSIVIVSFLVAVFGIVQHFSWTGKMFWLVQKPGSNFGPFVCYNHFAGFIEMTIYFAIGLFFSGLFLSPLRHMKRFRERIAWFSSKQANETVLYLFLATVMAGALFLCSSRGGNISFVLAFTVFVIVSAFISPKARKRKSLIFSFLVLGLFISMILWLGPEGTIARFMRLKEAIILLSEGKKVYWLLRPIIWIDTISLIKYFPFIGTGLGTYSDVFMPFRTFPGGWGFLRYAHQDYLHLLSEMGAVGGGFLVAFLVWYFRRFRECVRRLRLGAEHLEK